MYLEINQYMEYKNIEGFNKRYRIYPCGKIESYRYLKKKKKVKCLEMKQFTNNMGYKTVCLTKEGKRYWRLIHRLVAKAFIPNPECKPHINHMDLNPKNNHINNLEWVTPSENIQHAYDNNARITKIKSKDIPKIRADNRSLSEIANEYGVDKTNIWAIKKRKTWKHI